MRIFLTGVSGFIGSHLLQSLLLRDEVQKIYGLSRRKVSLDSAKAEMIHGSLADLATLKMTESVDILVHCAGVQNNYHGKKEEIYEQNMLGIKQAIAFCQENDIKKILFFSSINACLIQRSYYSNSKRDAERFVAESGLAYTIIRPALVFGQECTGMNYLIDYLKKHYFIPVIGRGDKLEQPVYIEELVHIVTQRILHFQSGRMEAVCGMKAMTYNDMLQEIAVVLGKKIRLVHLPVGLFLLFCRFMDRLRLPFPISEEQIYHINEDLAADMSGIYQELQMKPAHFAANLQKYVVD